MSKRTDRVAGVHVDTGGFLVGEAFEPRQWVDLFCHGLDGFCVRFGLDTKHDLLMAQAAQRAIWNRNERNFKEASR